MHTRTFIRLSQNQGSLQIYWYLFNFAYNTGAQPWEVNLEMELFRIKSVFKVFEAPVKLHSTGGQNVAKFAGAKGRNGLSRR